VQPQVDDAVASSQGPADCFTVPTFCELFLDIYRLFNFYSAASDAVPDSLHPDTDEPRLLGLGALLRLLRDANVLDNEVSMRGCGIPVCQ
jgi:hypothetical protein